MEQLILTVINLNYAITALQVSKVQGGWSAQAYKLSSVHGDYFLKVYDKSKYTVQEWIKAIDNYMPVVLWLYENTKLRKAMVAPIMTINGSYKLETDEYVFVVYPFIQGKTIAEEKLSQQQQVELAEIIANLHMCTDSIPCFKKLEKEDFATNFCDRLLSLIDVAENNKSLLKVWREYKNAIGENIAEVKSLAQALSVAKLNFVLCHTDLHGWNLLQAERLLLLDWEGLKLAPAEADLFAFSQGFFFAYAWDRVLEVYQGINKNFSLNADCLAFYRKRRRLEDIYDFASSILYDGLSEKETNISLQYLVKECSLLKRH